MTARTFARRGASLSVKTAAIAVDAVRRRPAGVTILLYHRVAGGSGTFVDLRLDVFRAQMQWLRTHADVLSLDAALCALSDGTAMSGRPQVVLTFDDGTTDFTDIAVPVLVEHGLPATLFVATAFVEEGRRWPDGCPSASWRALGDAVATGVVEVGSHTHEHRLLDRSAPGDVADDLDRSVDLIGDRLGVAARHFAYPKALAPGEAAERLVRERFASAALAGNRCNRPGATDVYRLGRTPVQTTDLAPFFARKARGGMRAEASVREIANRARYRGAQQ